MLTEEEYVNKIESIKSAIIQHKEAMLSIKCDQIIKDIKSSVYDECIKIVEEVGDHNIE